MTRVKYVAAALAIAAVAVLAGGVAAQETNTSERTFLTFSGAVEMPGTTLQPGTYVFKLADTPSRNVVQVWDNDEKNMIGQWLFVQAVRPEVTGENVVMFRETREGTTPAVQFWYFPGEKIGKEFIYPKDQAERIAARTGLDVRSDSGIVEGAGLAGIQPEPAAAAQSTTASAERAQSAPPTAGGAVADNRGTQFPAPAPAETSSTAIGTSGAAETQIARADTLPQTSSPLVLSGLIGLLSLAGAAGIRAMRR